MRLIINQRAEGCRVRPQKRRCKPITEVTTTSPHVPDLGNPLHSYRLDSSNPNTVTLSNDFVKGLREDFKLRSRYKRERRISQEAFWTIEKSLIRIKDYRLHYTPQAALDAYQQWCFDCVISGIRRCGRLNLQGCIPWVIAHKEHLSFQSFLKLKFVAGEIEHAD